MALYFELTSAQGTPARMSLQPGLQRIRAAIGDSYRIYDSATGKTPPDIVVKRFDSHMRIEGLPGGAEVELTDFYARCGVSAPCTLILETDSVFSQGAVEISPASPPLQALTDGSFVLYPSGYTGAPAVAVADGEGFPKAALYAVGGLAIAALAGAGGGGGGSSSAVSASPGAPAPAPSPAPAPAPAPGGSLDTVPPDLPIVTSGKSTDSRTPVITGSAEPGATVRVDIDTDRDGRVEASYLTVADGNGQWQVDLARQAPVSGSLPGASLPDSSSSMVTVIAIDASQNQSAPLQYALLVDATPPLAPRITAIVDDAPAKVGVVSNGGSTNDRSPTLQGRLDEPLAEGEQLQVLRNGEQIGAPIAVSGLAWSVTDSGLVFGHAYSYTARVVDAVGNTGTSSDYRIVVQAGTGTVASVTAVTDNVAPLTGNVANGAATNDNTPTISGTLSSGLVAGESLQVLRDGVVITAPVAIEGNTWRVTDGRLSDGTYTYTARVTDPEGSGAVSGGHRITVDTVNSKTATITSATDNVLPVIGNVPDGGTTNDSSPTLGGRLSSALGAGEELHVLRDGKVISTAPAVSGTDWTFTDSGLGNGNYDYTVRVVDAAGNLGKLSSTYDIRVSLTQTKSLTVGDLLDSGDSLLAVAEAPAHPVSHGSAASAIGPGSSALDELLGA